MKILVELSKVIDSEEILKILSKMMDDEIADIDVYKRQMWGLIQWYKTVVF